MKRTFIKALLAVGVVMVPSAVLVDVGSAAISGGNSSQCAGGASTAVCLFWNNDFGSPKTELTSPATTLGAMSDQASSIANNRNYRAFFYEHTNHGGWNVCLSRNSKNNDLPNDRNDEISSVNFASTYRYC